MARATNPARMAGNDKKEPRFKLEHLLDSHTFAARRDVAIAVLDPGKTYTIAEANEAIENFYERRVK